MKKIFLISHCQFMQLAFKSLFESKAGYEFALVKANALTEMNTKDATVLIHVNEDDYFEILSLLRGRVSHWLRKAIFITQKRLATLMGYLSMNTIMFIDEGADIDVFEREIMAEGGSCRTTERCEELSQAEYIVLRLVSSGMSLTTIAFRTRKSIKTISSQKISGLRKLGLNNSPHSLLNLFKLFH